MLRRNIYLGYNDMCNIIQANTSDEFEDEDESEADQDVESYRPQQSFQFIPSKKLKAIESKLSADQKAFIPEGKVRETMTNVYRNAMNTNVAVQGLKELNDQWDSMLNGPEASRVIGTFAQNFGKVVSSYESAKILDMLWNTMHMLLSKAGQETEAAGLGFIMSSLFELFELPNMPEVVNQAAGLIITTVNKPNAKLFIKQAFKEVQTMLKNKNLANEINMYFKTILAEMNNQKAPKKLNPLTSLKRRLH